MSWSQTLILIAILAVFLFWRRARRQVSRLRLEIEEHRDRNTFTFEAVDDADGRRFVIRDGEHGAVPPETLDWTEHGLELFRAEATDAASAIAPGTAVELIADDGDLGVWDRGMTRRLGVVDPAAAAAIRQRLDEDEVGGCMVLTAPAGAGRRMQLLLVHAGVDMDV